MHTDRTEFIQSLQVDPPEVDKTLLVRDCFERLMALYNITDDTYTIKRLFAIQTTDNNLLVTLEMDGDISKVKSFVDIINNRTVVSYGKTIYLSCLKYDASSITFSMSELNY